MRLVFDTQIYVEALRSPEGDAALLRLEKTGSSWMSAVVAVELLAGAPTAASREAAIVGPYVERGRIIAPSLRAWMRAGEAITTLNERRRIDRTKVLKSFVHDLLLAASCAEEEVTLVTKNARDFSLIAEEIPFLFVPPWAASR